MVWCFGPACVLVCRCVCLLTKVQGLWFGVSGVRVCFVDVYVCLCVCLCVCVCVFVCVFTGSGLVFRVSRSKIIMRFEGLGSEMI